MKSCAMAERLINSSACARPPNDNDIGILLRSRTVSRSSVTPLTVGKPVNTYDEPDGNRQSAPSRMSCTTWLASAKCSSPGGETSHLKSGCTGGTRDCTIIPPKIHEPPSFSHAEHEAIRIQVGFLKQSLLHERPCDLIQLPRVVHVD